LRASLEADDLAVLDEALDAAQALPAESLLCDPRSNAPFAIVDGWAGLTRTSSTGKRQVLALFLPGDFVGLDTATSPLRAGEVVALTSIRIRRLPTRGRALIVPRPNLMQAIAAHNLDHQARLQEQLFRIGVLSSFERVAHLLSELHTRLGSLTFDGRSLVPVRQEILAQTLGISLVHMNRTLQQLSQHKLAWFDRGRLIVPDPKALKTAGGG
jgi:CRP-like cAMP-binding protein